MLMAAALPFSHLRELSLVNVPRLKDKHLAPLTRLAGSLTSLQLTGCSSVTKAACPLVLGQLTNLRSLALSGTGVRPPFLQHLSRLTLLTSLDLGGCQVTNAELQAALPHLSSLRRLILWGCSAGDACTQLLAQLPLLQELDMAWSLLRAAVPAVFCGSLQQLDLTHCKLDGGWEEVATAAAVAASCGSAGVDAAACGGVVRLTELRLVHAAVSAGTAEVLESLIRSSSHTLQLLDCTSLSTDSLLPLLLALEAAAALKALSLASSHVPDDFLPTLVPCTALQTLDLSQNPDVTAAGLQATLPALQQLQQLNLSGTGVDDSVLMLLGQLPKLEHLVLADTAVTWEWDPITDSTTMAAHITALAATSA
ncbi:hypothetical protein OEZ85_008830 [Tetradesmus obliquus]|uniref:Uncharacterized protein n=1 Tax=Tetradesmus obliquus TaxID=3088 RepID=A0ABY8TKD0_TETOB|nr:hypothetical protein OEZ85_008830 [Tetradesmus obliquus]